MPSHKEFLDWPDGGVIMRPTPKASDLAVTRVERYASPVHVAVPTPAHASWERAQARWAAVAAEADADDADASRARDQGDGGAAGAGWVPSPGAGLPVNQYLIHFESDLFVGKMLVYIRGLPSSYEPYFAGKKRRSVLMFQVRSSNWGGGKLAPGAGWGDGPTLPARSGAACSCCRCQVRAAA
jgi:hypothetical protein